jgi:flagellar biosynthesis/type III secretory pathway protein FliH
MDDAEKTYEDMTKVRGKAAKIEVLREALDEAQRYGYDDGRSEGYEAGYDAGWQEGVADNDPEY